MYKGPHVSTLPTVAQSLLFSRACLQRQAKHDRPEGRKACAYQHMVGKDEEVVKEVVRRSQQ